MKFDQPLEVKLSDDISLYVSSAWLNVKSLPTVELQIWNGSMQSADTICIANYSARARFSKSVARRVNVPADKVEDALLLISGNLTRTLADCITEDATTDARLSQST